jgi:hypothetical protein
LPLFNWQLTVCTSPPCQLLQANSHQQPQHLTHLFTVFVVLRFAVLCGAHNPQTGQDLAPINTEAQVAEVKQAMEDELDADAELLGLKRKKKSAAAAADGTAAAGAAGASSSGAAEGAAGEGAAEASTSGAGGDDELVSQGSSVMQPKKLQIGPLCSLVAALTLAGRLRRQLTDNAAAALQGLACCLTLCLVGS